MNIGVSLRTEEVIPMPVQAKRAAPLTPVQIAAMHGWCRWPVSRIAREENARQLAEDAEVTDWLMLSGQVPDEQVMAVFRREAHVARDEHGNLVVVATAKNSAN